MLDTFLLPVVEIIRLDHSDSFGTFGVLKINKTAFCVTLEPSGRENIAHISSIPPSQYVCYKRKSPKFGLTFSVMSVPGRSNILFHSGNTKDDTTGCILLGEHFGKLRGNRAILNSGKTFTQFMSIMRDFKFFTLTIKEVY